MLSGRIALRIACRPLFLSPVANPAWICRKPGNRSGAALQSEHYFLFQRRYRFFQRRSRAGIGTRRRRERRILRFRLNAPQRPGRKKTSHRLAVPVRSYPPRRGRLCGLRRVQKKTAPAGNNWGRKFECTGAPRCTCLNGPAFGPFQNRFSKCAPDEKPPLSRRAIASIRFK